MFSLQMTATPANICLHLHEKLQARTSQLSPSQISDPQNHEEERRRGMAIDHELALCHRLLDRGKRLFLAATTSCPVGRCAGNLSTWLDRTLAKKVKDIYIEFRLCVNKLTPLIPVPHEIEL